MQIGLVGPLYAGGDMEFGGLDTMPQANLFVLDGTLGARATVADLIGLRVELAGGFRSVKPAMHEESRGDGLLQARVRVDLWVTPWITLGATVGESLDRAETTVIVSIGGHVVAFDH
jgi:hypothetical protein